MLGEVQIAKLLAFFWDDSRPIPERYKGRGRDFSRPPLRSRPTSRRSNQIGKFFVIFVQGVQHNSRSLFIRYFFSLFQKFRQLAVELGNLFGLIIDRVVALHDLVYPLGWKKQVENKKYFRKSFPTLWDRVGCTLGDSQIAKLLAFFLERF